MKKIVLLLVLMSTFLSCSIGDADSYTNHYLPVESYTLPETFTVNQSHEITLTYQKPTACYNYRGIYYGKDGYIRTIAIMTDTKDGQNCSESLPPVSTVSFLFQPETTGTYTFKFYKGSDVSGNDIFEDVEIVVNAAN